MKPQNPPEDRKKMNAKVENQLIRDAFKESKKSVQQIRGTWNSFCFADHFEGNSSRDIEDIFNF